MLIGSGKAARPADARIWACLNHTISWCSEIKCKSGHGIRLKTCSFGPLFFFFFFDVLYDCCHKFTWLNKIIKTLRIWPSVDILKYIQAKVLSCKLGLYCFKYFLCTVLTSIILGRDALQKRAFTYSLF